MIKNILATVDGSSYSNAVVRHSIELSRKYDAVVRFLSIVDVRISEWAVYIGVDGFLPTLPVSTYRKDTQKLLEEKAEEVLKICVQEASESGIQFVAQKVSGSPVEVICEQARMVDLIIMGRRGEYARWGHKLMGATLDGTVRQANKPILVLPKEYREIGAILLAYDRSPQANHALQIAADLASRLSKQLVVLAVDEDETAGKSTLNEAAEYLRPFKLTVSSQVRKGGASEAILQVCEAEKIDLVIMGVHGHTRLMEALLGSTTEDVLRRIELPLLLAQ